MKRKQNQTKILSSLLSDRGHRCEFCGDVVYRVSSIPEERRISVNNKWVCFVGSGGVPVTGKVATVEHVCRLADGGSYHRSNLRVACGECNGKRNKAIQKTEVEQARRNLICILD